jgi:CBS domain containing-hemolysin-like protein
MEDLLEEIVGQIYDEYDQPEPGTPGQETEATPVLPGSTPIDEVNETYGLGLDDADYTTLGGLLFGALGRLPRVGDRVTVNGAAFEIVAMDGRRVGSARLLQRAAPA